MNIHGEASLMTDNPNPKYVVIDLYSKTIDKLGDGPKAISSVKNPSIIDVVAENNGSAWQDEKELHEHLVGRLRAHLKKHGTIDEIIFAGHGSPGDMSDGNGDNSMDILSMLRAMEQVQHETGKQITKRVVFAACNTFSNLSAHEIESLRDQAKRTHTEIVGTTSYAWMADIPIIKQTAGLLFDQEAVYSGDYATMRAVCFTPKGEVRRDKLDHRYALVPLLTSDDRNWVDYHLGHTQAEAVQVMQKDIVTRTEQVIKLAVAADIPRGGFDSYTNTSLNYQVGVQLNNIKQVDRINPNVGVVFSNHSKAAVVVEDNTVHSFGGIVPHQMQKSERTTSIQKFEQELRDTTLEDAKRLNMLEYKKFSVSLIGDTGQVLIADRNGAYEVVNLKDGSHVTPNINLVQHGQVPAKTPQK